MLKRLFVIVLFMMLSITVFPEVVKADAYEYENINELVDSVASIINKKNTYEFKYKFNRSDFHLDLDVTINWKTKIVSFNGFIFRPETDFKKEKFSAVLNLKSKQVKTSSKAYKKGRNMLSYLIGVWNFEKDDNEHRKSLGHYLLGIFELIDKDTTINESGDKVIVNRVKESEYTTYYYTVTTNKSKVLKIEMCDVDNIMKVEMK